MTQSVTVKFDDGDFEVLKRRSGRVPLASYVRALVLEALRSGREPDPDDAQVARGGRVQRVTVDLTPAVEAVEESTAALQGDHDEMLALLHEIRLRLDVPEPPPRRSFWFTRGEPERREVRDAAREAAEKWRKGNGTRGDG